MTEEKTNKELIKQYWWLFVTIVLCGILAIMPTMLEFKPIGTLITFVTGWTMFVTAVLTGFVLEARRIPDYQPRWTRRAAVLGALLYIAGLAAIYINYLTGFNGG